MAVIDLVKWDGNPNIVAWKYPSQELSTWTQLIVNETQEAYLVKEGVYQGPFGAGRHTLSTENIPLLSQLMALPFGGKSPFTAEVWYVNRITNLAIKWGTPDPIQLTDPKFQIMIPVRAFGQYGIRVVNSKKFLLKLVGTLSVFSADTVAEYFKGVFATKIKSGIANAIIKNGHSVLEISTELEVLSEMLKLSLAPEMDDYGIELVQLNINSINVPETDPAVITLKTALAKRAEMGLLGFSYQQERSFDVMQTAAGNSGTAGGVMGAGLGMGMGVGMGVPMGKAFSQIAPHVNEGISHSSPFTPSPDSKGSNCVKCNTSNLAGARFCISCGSSLQDKNKSTVVTCDKCNSPIPNGSKFCPNCADAVFACPSCGQDNPKEAKQCRDCGKPMPVNCVSCTAPVPAGSKFCPDCGTKTGIACKKCGADISAGIKFCNNCGEPQ